LTSLELDSITTIILEADERYKYFYEVNSTFTTTVAEQMGFDDLNLIQQTSFDTNSDGLF